MNFYKITSLSLVALFFVSCKQEIIIKEHRLTGINPIAYTDVVYNASVDTVLVSTFNGKIYQLTNGSENKKQIASIDDEIYNLIYNDSEKELYAATLNSGIIVINILNGTIINKLSIQESWAYQLCFNDKNTLLATFDFKGKNYIWETKNNFRKIETPPELNQMRLKYIADNGDIYFEGKGKIIVWNYATNNIEQQKVRGKIVDVDDDKNMLMIGNGDKDFFFYNYEIDSVFYQKKHPDWPIHIPEKDSIVYVPLSLEIISGAMANKFAYTYGLDKSIRKWNKLTGELLETNSKHKGTISGIHINKRKNQLVTVDLLGGIQFWDLSK